MMQSGGRRMRRILMGRCGEHEFPGADFVSNDAIHALLL
jgi:hypothetical protein